tara:strand:- start:587 stop:1219 length:633 start_codon:yes stop_codon:yes gene_type:complete
MWLNSDDLLLNGSLDSIAKNYNSCKSKENFVALGRRVYMDYKSVVTGHLSFSLFMGDFNSIAWGISRGPHQEASCWSREIWDRNGPLDQKFNYAFDLDFFLKIFKCQPNIYIIPDFIGAWRLWELNKCTVEPSKMADEVKTVKNIHKKFNSIYKNRYVKKLFRKTVKTSQTSWAYLDGLPLIGQSIKSDSKITQKNIPFFWEKILSSFIS